MANKGPSYGLSKQVQDKIDSKYDPELEQILVEWITRQCGSEVGRPEPGKLGFQAWLKNGCVSRNPRGFHSLPFSNVQFIVTHMLPFRVGFWLVQTVSFYYMSTFKKLKGSVKYPAAACFMSNAGVDDGVSFLRPFPSHQFALPRF